MLLADTVAVVSGAGAGLGLEICRAYAREGARLVVGDLDEQALAAVQEELADQVHVQRTDITDADDCRRLAEAAVRLHGRIDVLVNDAYHGGDFRTFADADLDDWRATAEVNVWGTLRMTKAVVPRMREQGHGRVVMVVTQGVEWVQAGFGAYTGSKAALAHFVKLLATELGPDGIRVNGVFPGPLWGPALQGHLGGLAEQRGVPLQTVYDEWAADTALRHLVTPAETAGAAVFLASELASWITGQAIYVNAGQWLH